MSAALDINNNITTYSLYWFLITEKAPVPGYQQYSPERAWNAPRPTSEVILESARGTSGVTVKIKKENSMTKALGFLQREPLDFYAGALSASFSLSSYFSHVNHPFHLVTRGPTPCLTSNFCLSWLPSFPAATCYYCLYTFLFHEPFDDLNSRVVKVISGIVLFIVAVVLSVIESIKNSLFLLLYTGHVAGLCGRLDPLRLAKRN